MSQAQQSPDPSSLPTNSPLHQPIIPPGPGSARPADKTAFEIAAMTATERAAHEEAQRGFDDRSDPTRFVHVRGPDGSVTIKERSPATQSQPTDRPVAPAGDGSQPVVDGDKLKLGDLELSAQEARDLMTAKGDAELRKAQLPASPEVYELRLPDNFEMPAGVEFKVNPADPLFVDARNWAHSKGFDQATFSEMVGLYASAQARDAAQLNAAHADQVAKMGPNGAQRVTALDTWLRGMVGDKLAGPMRTMMVTADIVKGLETLQQKFSSQGAASFRQDGREPGGRADRVSDEQWAGMSNAQKIDYARQFPQPQFAERR